MLDPHRIIQWLTARYGKRVFWVAYSGGVDSHVLLHILAKAGMAVKAIHIDHGLHSESANWARHCAAIAAQLAVPFVSIPVTVERDAASGLEAAARRARYQALAHYLDETDILLTAQHQHDQAETVLLQLLRGAGPQGLAAMAPDSKMGALHIVRPLLEIGQDDILAYAHEYQLHWIDDPSNDDIRWSRNYVRHAVWPVIEAHWPAAAQTLARSASHCAQAQELFTALAERDLAQIVDTRTQALTISKLLALSTARQNNVLRYTIQQKQFALPSTKTLRRIIEEVCLAREDAQPLVRWADVEVRRFQGKLYILPAHTDADSHRIWHIQSIQPLDMGHGNTLVWHKAQTQGIAEQYIHQGLTVRYRQGGERIQISGQRHHQTLKHLFQQWQVPPWQRDRLPLIFAGETLIAVPGYGISEAVVAKQGAGFIPVLNTGEG